MGSIEGKECRD